MKRNILFQLALATTCFLSTMALICSCNGSTHKNTDTQPQTDIVTTSLDSLNLERQPDSILYMQYNFQFLKPTGTVSDSINAGITQFFISGKNNTDIHKAINDKMAKEEKEMQAEIQEFYDPDDETYGIVKYRIIRTGRFHHNAHDTVIVYHGSDDIYTGGAHGSYTPFTVNFSKKTGHIIRIEDILDTTKENEILDLMFKKLLQDKQCNTREELMEKTSLLTIGDLYLTPNFHLSKDSIIFCFGQYEIAPYSGGITYISLDYNTLQPYLKN